MYVTPILFRGSAFGFSGMGRCRLLPSPIAASRGACPFSVCPTRYQLPPVFRFPGWIAVGYRPVEGALAQQNAGSRLRIGVLCFERGAMQIRSADNFVTQSQVWLRGKSQLQNQRSSLLLGVLHRPIGMAALTPPDRQGQR